MVAKSVHANTKRRHIATGKPRGRPPAYRPEYVDLVVTFCAKGHSLTGFAGKVGVSRDTVLEWGNQHPDFREACHVAKANRALWWEEQAIKVAKAGGSSTMVLFGMRNAAPDDYQDIRKMEQTGKDGGPIVYEDKRARAAAIVDEAFAASTTASDVSAHTNGSSVH